MGGAGNVAEVHTALIAALVHQGLSYREAQNQSPWFFPSEKLITQLLEEAGFVVEKTEMEYRPTQASEGGVEGWVRLMGAPFLDALSGNKKEAAVRDVCETLSYVMTHEEDGTCWFNYVRLRVKARKA
jgi:trans-aconitate methyltransferase